MPHLPVQPHDSLLEGVLLVWCTLHRMLKHVAGENSIILLSPRMWSPQPTHPKLKAHLETLAAVFRLHVHGPLQQLICLSHSSQVLAEGGEAEHAQDERPLDNINL